MPKSDTQFKKGQSGNPDGRAKRTKELSLKISEFDEVYRQRLHNIALTGKHMDSTLAIKLLWAYAHGNPTQMVTGGDGGPIQVQSVDLMVTLKALARSSG